MCSPFIMAEVDRVVADRRRFLKSAAGSCAAAAGIGSVSVASTGVPEPANEQRSPATFTRAVDLTHTLRPDFPAWFAEGQVIMGRTAPASLSLVDEFVIDEEMPFALKKVSYWEHVGTHVDAASHCSAGGTSVDEIPAEELVAPLAVIDIREEAAADPLAQVTPEHVRRWEAVNGPLPPRCFVAMNSGWAEKADDPKAFFCADESGGGATSRQPAFHPDTARMLLEDREVVGIGVDTLSFDNSRSNGLDVHLIWLPENRWGVENLNDLSKVPVAGATIVVGAPKFKGCTGGPARVLALV